MHLGMSRLDDLLDEEPIAASRQSDLRGNIEKSDCQVDEDISIDEDDFYLSQERGSISRRLHVVVDASVVLHKSSSVKT